MRSMHRRVREHDAARSAADFLGGAGPVRRGSCRVAQAWPVSKWLILPFVTVKAHRVRI
jgi:hypothetical protein